MLGEARTGCDASRAHGGAIQCDYLAQVSTSSSQSECRKELHQTLDERTNLLGLQEMDLGVHEAILAEELEHSLCHPDGCNLLAELDETRAWVHGIADDQGTKVRRLSR
jgi:hypothetical protein